MLSCSTTAGWLRTSARNPWAAAVVALAASRFPIGPRPRFHFTVSGATLRCGRRDRPRCSAEGFGADGLSKAATLTAPFICDRVDGAASSLSSSSSQEQDPSLSSSSSEASSEAYSSSSGCERPANLESARLASTMLSIPTTRVLPVALQHPAMCARRKRRVQRGGGGTRDCSRSCRAVSSGSSHARCRGKCP